MLLISTWGCYITANRSMTRVMGRFDVFFRVISFRRAFIRSVAGITPYPQTANPKADFKGAKKTLSFTTLSSPLPSTTTDEVPVSQVRWVEFDKDSKGGHRVRAHPHYFLSDRTKEGDFVDEKRFPELERWEFDYHDGSSWSSAWDFSIKKRLPEQVRVKYKIATEFREIEDVITVKIAQEPEPWRLQQAVAAPTGQVGGEPDQPVVQPGAQPAFQAVVEGK